MTAINKGFIRRALVVTILVLINLGCDQVTKAAARNSLQDRGIVSVLGGFFVLVYTENEGAFLGLGSKWPEPLRRTLFTFGPAALVLLMLGYVLIYRNLTLFQIVALACIIGGGLSNVVDRILYQGRVTDFMNLGLGSLRTGVFNAADLSVLLGSALLLISSLFGGSSDKKQDEESVSESDP